MFSVTVQTDNAAFGDNAETGQGCDEVARILDEIAKRLRKGVRAGRCTDINGNPVGQWSLEGR